LVISPASVPPGLGWRQSTSRRSIAIAPAAPAAVNDVLRKLDCHDRAALVALAYESGLVTPGDDA
jgi:hypothetical protein